MHYKWLLISEMWSTKGNGTLKAPCYLKELKLKQRPNTWHTLVQVLGDFCSLDSKNPIHSDSPLSACLFVCLLDCVVLLCGYFERGPCCVAQASLELTI